MMKGLDVDVIIQYNVNYNFIHALDPADIHRRKRNSNSVFTNLYCKYTYLTMRQFNLTGYVNRGISAHVIIYHVHPTCHNFHNSRVLNQTIQLKIICGFLQSFNGAFALSLEMLVTTQQSLEVCCLCVPFYVTIYSGGFITFFCNLRAVCDVVTFV